MADCKPYTTPLDPSFSLTSDQCPTTDEEKQAMATVPYRQAVGRLNYLAVSTRPDIAAAVSIVSRFSHNPGIQHWGAVKHILSYLKGTINYSLRVSPSNMTLAGYSDANWGGDPDNRRSTSGYCFFLGGSLVSWKSIIQKLFLYQLWKPNIKLLVPLFKN